MAKIVEREKNKLYYRALHLPIWVWVFFILPGHLTYLLYLYGPNWRHNIWLAIVFIVCVWRGLAGRLPGVEPQPYVKYYGADQLNLPYRVVCYTAAWIDLLVPFILNFSGLTLAAITGKWYLAQLYTFLYYPLALILTLVAYLDWLPRARRSTRNEGVEKGWFYVAIWTVVPTQVAAWAAWRLGSQLNMSSHELDDLRFAVFVLTGTILFLLGLREKLPRTKRHHLKN